MHFAYALIVGGVAAILIRRWPLRLLVLTYPILVFVTIVGTANHYVLDAFAGGAVVCSAFAATALWRRRRGRNAKSAAQSVCTQ